MERELRGKLANGSFGNVPESHSRRMGAIRGTGNRTTEARFRAMLVRAGVRGWILNTNSVRGKPDFFFPKKRIAVFIDGCFWHGCPVCGHIPSVNRAFWKAKIHRNQERDRSTDRMLRDDGIRTLRLWEHELLTPKQCLEWLHMLLHGRERKAITRVNNGRTKR